MGNDPLNKSDPTGLAELPFGIKGGVTAGIAGEIGSGDFGVAGQAGFTLIDFDPRSHKGWGDVSLFFSQGTMAVNPNDPDRKKFVGGVSGGLGLGLVFTNAKNAGEFAGINAKTGAINFIVATVTWSKDPRTGKWVATITAGKGIGASGSNYYSSTSEVGKVGYRPGDSSQGRAPPPPPPPTRGCLREPEQGGCSSGGK